MINNYLTKEEQKALIEEAREDWIESVITDMTNAEQTEYAHPMQVLLEAIDKRFNEIEKRFYILERRLR